MTITSRRKASVAIVCGLLSCLMTSLVLAQTDNQSTLAEAKPAQPEWNLVNKGPFPINTPRIDIEAHFVSISAEDLKSFNIDFKPISASIVINPHLAPETTLDYPSFSIGTVANYQQTLTALIRENKAEIVNVPPIAAYDNQALTLSHTLSSPAVIGITHTATGIGSVLSHAPTLKYLPSGILLNLTPALAAENTIRLNLTPDTLMPSRNRGQLEFIPLSTHAQTAIAFLKNGEYLAIRGFRTRTIPTNIRDKPSTMLLHPGMNDRWTSSQTYTEKEIIILVIPRIIELTPGAGAG